ncbi:MAG: PAS domain S-box protein [Thermoleophilia bacterium]|nr:PAS domain S-box protein [Thermoleophilia bacterium]
MDAALRQPTLRPSVEQELRARVAQQAAIAALGRRALAAPTLDAVLQDAVEVVARTLGVGFGAVLELEPDGRLLLRAGSGWPAEIVGRTWLPNTARTHSGWTLRQGNGQPVVVDDVRAETRFEFSPAIREHGIQSGIAVAIGPADRPYGVLAAHHRVPRSFSDDNAAFLQAAANTLAAAVDGFSAAAQVREAEERFRTLVERLPMITWSIEFGDPPGYYVSPQVERILGFASDEWSYDAYVSRIHPDDRERVLAAVPPYRMLEYRLLDKDDRVVWVHDEAELSTDPDGWVRGIQGFNVDVTHRKQQEELLRASEQRFRALFDTALDAIVLADDDARCIDANPAACELFGVECMVGMALADVLAPSHRASAPAVWSDFLARGEHRGELELTLANGAPRRLELSARANFLPEMHLGVFRDVAERKRLEEQLLQAQKMEAVGRLAGGVAHDFNNLLLVIRGYGDLLLQRLEGKQEATDVREITAAAERAASLTGQLLAFSRRQVVDPRTLALHEVVRETEGRLRKVLGDVELTTELGDEGSFVRADRVQLDQVLLNLAVNARDAMPDGGRFGIETSTLTLSPPAAAGLGLAPGEYVALAAIDTGHGMDAETLAHIFEPFFTTKSPDLGTGLGLSTVYGIATQAGGTVLASSTPGAGSTLTLYLPRHATGTVEDEPLEDDVDVAGAETILLVEDDERVRLLVSQMLASFGYSVTAVGDPTAAVELAGRLEPLDLLLTDVVMPGLNGPQVAARSRHLRPGLPVLFMSGHAEGRVIEEQVLGREENLIHKPFSRDELGRKLREVLARRASAA